MCLSFIKISIIVIKVIDKMLRIEIRSTERIPKIFFGKIFNRYRDKDNRRRDTVKSAKMDTPGTKIIKKRQI